MKEIMETVVRVGWKSLDKYFTLVTGKTLIITGKVEGGQYSCIWLSISLSYGQSRVQMSLCVVLSASTTQFHSALSLIQNKLVAT